MLSKVLFKRLAASRRISMGMALSSLHKMAKVDWAPGLSLFHQLRNLCMQASSKEEGEAQA